MMRGVMRDASQRALLLLVLLAWRTSAQNPIRPPVLSPAITTVAASASFKGQTHQPGVDVLDYDVTMELPDTGAFIRGDVLVTARRAAGVSQLTLDLIDALTVRSVEVNGRAVAARHADGLVSVPLAGTTDSVRVRVVYDGIVRDGLVVRKDARGRWTWFGDNWPDRARQWLPTVDHPSDKATVSWTVIAAPGLTVVANGEFVASRAVRVNAVSRKETKWRESRPIATYLMVIAVGPLTRFDLREPDCHFGDQGQCVRQTVYVMPENAKWLPGTFLAAGPIMSLFERLIGPFPYEKLAHLQSATRFGGMENASAIFYSNDLFPNHTIKDHLIAHETAHQWFGDAVTEREWAHVWLSEGFATYFAALWTQHIRGDAAFRTEMATIRKQILDDTVVFRRPVIDSTQTDLMALLNTNSYQKGGYVLYMLHQKVGDSAFFGALRSYYASYRHGTALTDDLRAEMEQTSKQSLKYFFDDWLRRPGVAEPAIGWAYDASKETISLRVLQKGDANYELPLPVVMTDAAGVTTRLTVNVARRDEETITLPGRYPARPRAITFDPDEQLLARITRL